MHNIIKYHIVQNSTEEILKQSFLIRIKRLNLKLRRNCNNWKNSIQRKFICKIDFNNYFNLIKKHKFNHISQVLFFGLTILLISVFNSCTKEETLTPKRSRLVKYTYTYSTDTTSTLYTRIVSYDNNNRISESYLYKSNTMTAFWYYKYVSDSNKNLKQIILSDNDDNQWKYTIGANGYVSNEVLNDTSSEINYTYDSNNYLLKSLTSNGNDCYVYTYKNGNCTQMTDTYLDDQNRTVTCSRVSTYDNNNFGAFAQPIIFTIDLDTWNLMPVNFYGTNNKNYLTHVSDTYKFSDGSETDETCDIKYQIDENQNITKVILSFNETSKTENTSWYDTINLYYENY